MEFRLQLQNYKAHRHFDWSPSGVCALVGPNGGGKTTALRVLDFLRIGIGSDIPNAIEFIGGRDVRNFHAPSTEPCEISVSLDDVTWTLRPSATGISDERVTKGAHRLVPRLVKGVVPLPTSEPGPPKFKFLRALAGSDETVQQIAPLAFAIAGFRMYGEYALPALRKSGSQTSSDTRLESDGSNIFAVLRNWRDKGAHEHRWEFVREKLITAFPKFFRRLDFEAAGSVVNASVLTPDGNSVPSAGWANGFFATLIHLAAIASTNKDDIVAIDEPETSLHPALIRWLIGEFRNWSADNNVTILLATHSPVVIDCFKESPDQLYVLEPGQPKQPIALDELKSSDWLSMFELGDLYAKAKIGAPEVIPES